MAESDPAHAVATRIIAGAATAEPAVTPDVMAIAARVGGRTARLESRLKTRKSIVDKLTRPGVDLAQEASDMNDALRYTIVASEARYMRSYAEVKAAFEGAGYTVTFDPGGWKPAGYKGINMTLRSPGGYRFEAQLHTAASLRASDATHSLYEEKRRLAEGTQRWLELTEEIDRIYAAVPWPPDLPRLG